MIVIQYIENPKAAISVFDDFSEKAQRLSLKTAIFSCQGIAFWQSAVFLLTSLTVPIIVIFEYPSPVRALGALLTQLGRLEIPITES